MSLIALATAQFRKGRKKHSALPISTLRPTGSKDDGAFGLWVEYVFTLYIHSCYKVA